MSSESGLAAPRLAAPSGGMTALWCSLWLSVVLPLCVAPARLPTAPPTGRRTQQRALWRFMSVLPGHTHTGNVFSEIPGKRVQRCGDVQHSAARYK
ncbi:hypothetical protein F2P81_026221 [Scophthalmus maximus]|uniref:Uncharacterized protein n=1 Tax=Scophthalmus maximus TaxID=52904 RepID=A0A6A4RGB2_SCOMX|nr:hypothetical protein F2P81_026221 [Scophthalmus maximus]